MTTHAIIKVGDTHHGPIPPGLLIVVPVEDIKFSEKDSTHVYFFNSVENGWSSGTFIQYVELNG